MHFVDAKGILTGSGGHFGMNVYRGCSHGCIYCDSRSKCYQFTHEFEDIEVKQNAPELLEEAREIIEGDRYVLTEADKQEIAGMVDISGKEDTIYKKPSISNQSQTGDSDTNYPTVGAVRDYTEGKVSDLESYIDNELDDMDTAKADKATTIAGYGIIDAFNKGEVLTRLNLKANAADVYTKTEIDSQIGNIETLLSQV